MIVEIFKNVLKRNSWYTFLHFATWSGSSFTITANPVSTGASFSFAAFGSSAFPFTTFFFARGFSEPTEAFLAGAFSELVEVLFFGGG